MKKLHLAVALIVGIILGKLDSRYGLEYGEKFGRYLRTLDREGFDDNVQRGREIQQEINKARGNT